MHDSIIDFYSMNFQTKTLNIHSRNAEESKKYKLIIRDVLTFSFECILEDNVILDIEEKKIVDFQRENENIIKKLRNCCWPVCYQNVEELQDFLEDNNYKYIKVLSSYGLYGWILAKAYDIETLDECE